MQIQEKTVPYALILFEVILVSPLSNSSLVTLIYSPKIYEKQVLAGLKEEKQK